MEVPLEIAFHNVESSKPAEEEIRARVADLERIYGRLISCRVRVEQRAVNPGHTIPPVVHIELGLPGRKHFLISHEPEHLLRKYKHPDLHHAIVEAFRLAERQLVEIKEQRNGRNKNGHHDSAHQSSARWPRSRPSRTSDS